MKIKDIFKLGRAGEEKKFKSKIGNDMLLCHGSRISNFAGILSQGINRIIISANYLLGLRIAPPEAPVSGYFFGKGVYFADMIQMAQFFANFGLSPKNEGAVLLSRVALGTPNLKYAFDHNANELPKGKNRY